MTSRLVSTVVVNAAFVSGTIGVVGVATVVDVRMPVRTPIPSVSERPTAMLTLARVERRISAPT